MAHPFRSKVEMALESPGSLPWVSLPTVSKPTSTISFSSDHDDDENSDKQQQVAAELLLSVAGIVQQEITSDASFDWEDDVPTIPPLNLEANTTSSSLETPLCADAEATDDTNRTRSVSIDVSENLASYHSSSSSRIAAERRIRRERPSRRAATAAASVVKRDTRSTSGATGSTTSSSAALVTPTTSPSLPPRRAKVLTPKLADHVTKAVTITTTNNSNNNNNKATITNNNSHKSKLPAKGSIKGPIIRTILRKKFSWKNYPELEAFLVANREEYLRHSALNYTIQQKMYNNRLTERLLELAAEHGYVFDAEAFSFVTVRDRIRCYFKSYVQSAKKRGVIIGYAAKKAGLVTQEDLEEAASGDIVMPHADETSSTGSC